MRERRESSEPRARESDAQSFTISATPRSAIEAASCEVASERGPIGAKISDGAKRAAGRFHDEYAAVRGGDEAVGLIERGLADSGKIQQRGELFRELLNQVHFAV